MFPFPDHKCVLSFPPLSFSIASLHPAHPGSARGSMHPCGFRLGCGLHDWPRYAQTCGIMVIVTFSFPSLLRHPHHSPLDTHRTPPHLSSLSSLQPRPPSLISFSSDTPEHHTPTALWIFPGSSQISSSSHGHPSPGPSLIPFPCFTFISTPLLPYHHAFPYLASIFDPQYHH